MKPLLTNFDEIHHLRISRLETHEVEIMPSYAILGATGQTGGAILEVLMQSDKNQVRAYCRSKSKLFGQYPAHAKDPRLEVFEGSLDDTTLLAECCRGVRAVFMCVAAKQNQPGCTIAQDTAHQVIAAMQLLRKEQTMKLPTLVVLSSSSTEPHLCRNMPYLGHALLYRAMWYIYTDLEAAERFLRPHQDWINITYMKPGAISHDVQGGHVLSTESQVSPVSFLDVAAGMVELGDRSEEFAGKAVSVHPKAEKVKIPWEAPLALVQGLVLCYFPWMWRFIGA